MRYLSKVSREKGGAGMLPDWNGGYRYQTQYCILRVPLLSSQYSLTMSDYIYIYTYICTYAVHSNVKKNVTACAHIFLTLRRCPTSVLDSCTSIGSGIAALLLFVVFEYWTFFWLEQLCLHIVARKLQTLPTIFRQGNEPPDHSERRAADS